jgi:hypothetical protein
MPKHWTKYRSMTNHHKKTEMNRKGSIVVVNAGAVATLVLEMRRKCDYILRARPLLGGPSFRRWGGGTAGGAAMLGYVFWER